MIPGKKIHYIKWQIGIDSNDYVNNSGKYLILGIKEGGELEDNAMWLIIFLSKLFNIKKKQTKNNNQN